VGSVITVGEVKSMSDILESLYNFFFVRCLR